MLAGNTVKLIWWKSYQINKLRGGANLWGKVSRRCYNLGHELKDEELIRPSAIR